MEVKIKYKGQNTWYIAHVKKESVDNVTACLLDDVHTKAEVRDGTGGRKHERE